VKVAARLDRTHNPCDETRWVSRLRENLTSGSYGEGLETGRRRTLNGHEGGNPGDRQGRPCKALPRQSLTRQEHIKRQKRWAEIENLSGRSLLAVRQDIQAKILAMNLSAMVRNVAQLIATRRFAQRKLAYQVRACSALSAMKHNLVRLLFADPGERRRLLEDLIQYLCGAVEAVRPDRSFPRSNPGKLKPGFHLAYKRAA